MRNKRIKTLKLKKDPKEVAAQKLEAEGLAWKKNRLSLRGLGYCLKKFDEPKTRLGQICEEPKPVTTTTTTTTTIAPTTTTTIAPIPTTIIAATSKPEIDIDSSDIDSETSNLETEVSQEAEEY
jgi:hypothetical protein